MKTTRLIPRLLLAMGNLGLLCCIVSTHSAPPTFDPITIDPEPPRSPWIKITGDIDKDGQADLIIGGQNGPLVWYSNPGWNKMTIADGGYASVDGEAADIDNDGDLDVVVGGVFWYENPLPDARPGSGHWKAHRVANYRAHDIEVGDLDGDGKLDIVARDQSRFGSKQGDRIVLFKQVSLSEWSRRDLRCPHGEGLKLADLDRDGDLDVVIGGRWFGNPGKVLDVDWPEHIYTARWDHEDCNVALADFNNDDRLDIVLSPAELKGGKYRVAWYAAPADPKAPDWEETVVVPEIETVVHALDTGDFNNDGTPDIALAMMHQGAAPQEVTVYLNSEQGRRWTKHVVSEKGSHNIIVVDLNGDGRPDVFGANHAGPYQPVEVWLNRLSRSKGEASVKLIEDAEDPGVPGLACFKIETPAAIYFLEKIGAGLSSIIDRDGNNWINFNPRPGTGAAGEYRGFPNAVHRSAGNYFHPRNNATDPSITKVERIEPDRVSIQARSSNGLWSCRYDFFQTHCTFTMTRMPSGQRYWVLYEGTPGGRYDDNDWWMSSAIQQRQPLTKNHEGDIPSPEWIVFGDATLDRVLFLLQHEDDEHPDRFYQMQRQMTVFGFGRSGLDKFIGSTNRQFSIGFIEATDHSQITRALEQILPQRPPE